MGFTALFVRVTACAATLFVSWAYTSVWQILTHFCTGLDMAEITLQFHCSLCCHVLSILVVILIRFTGSVVIPRATTYPAECNAPYIGFPGSDG